MLVSDMRVVGNKLLNARKKLGLTQAQVAEKAGLSDRTYADIERGNANMRAETLLHICCALKITPDDLFTEEKNDAQIGLNDLIVKLESCTPKEQETALKILSAYLESI